MTAAGMPERLIRKRARVFATWSRISPRLWRSLMAVISLVMVRLGFFMERPSVQGVEWSINTSMLLNGGGVNTCSRRHTVYARAAASGKGTLRRDAPTVRCLEETLMDSSLPCDI